MSNQKKSRGLFRLIPSSSVSTSVSGSNLVTDPPGGLATSACDAQSTVEQNPHQATLLPSTIGDSRREYTRLPRKSPLPLSPPPSPWKRLFATSSAKSTARESLTPILKATEQTQGILKSPITIDHRVLKLLEMLTQLEPLQRHQEVKLSRSKGTGLWLPKLESFIEWRNRNTIEENGNVFCCYGKPGAGKTVISSVVIDNLHSQCPDIGVACLYADYRDQANQTLVRILGTFLHQLLTTARESIPYEDEVIVRLCGWKNEGWKVTAEDNLALLKLRLNQLKHAYICIDAVDELELKVRRQLFNALKELDIGNTSLFLTGRGHIESEVQEYFQVPERYTIVISANEQDIKTFVGQQIIFDPYPDAVDELLEKEITDAIIKKSQGIFLLPSLHIKMILELPTISQRREVLEMLPTNLNDTFRSIMTRIRGRPTGAELGMRVLMWLHFALRSLTLVELQHALAVRKTHVEFDTGNIPSRKALLDSCLGLVIVNEETLKVRFVHFTLEEYFHDNARIEFPNGYSSIAETCLTYLNFSNLRQHCTNLDILEENLSKYPFLNYAALYWGIYVRQQRSGGLTLTTLIRMIVEHESERPPCAIQALYLEISNKFTRKFSGAHVIAYFGLDEIVVDFSMELKDDNGRTPLSWAAERGHEAVVRLLVKRDDVDINAKDNEGITPLIFAAVSGHKGVVQPLIERDDIEVNAKDGTGKTALIWAAGYGYEAVVRQLLIERNDVEINARDSEGKTALIWAAENGYEAVVRQLLIEGDNVEIDAKDNEGKTAIKRANANRYKAVVQLLIKRGARVPMIIALSQRRSMNYHDSFP